MPREDINDKVMSAMYGSPILIIIIIVLLVALIGNGESINIFAFLTTLVLIFSLCVVFVKSVIYYRKNIKD